MPRRKPGRRPRGSGYATKAPSGTWTAYYPKFGGGYHVRRGFRTRQDAEAWCDALAAQRAQKVDVARGQQRTGDWIEFLDDEHERMVQILYERRKLAYEQEDDAYDEEYEFDEVFEDFVSGWIGVAWDMAKDESSSSHGYQRPSTA